MRYFINCVSLSILILTSIACSKSERIIRSENDATKRSPSIAVSEPLVFSSVENLVEAIKRQQGKGNKAKGEIGNDFISFAATVMEEDDYDDRANAIYSEAFGSILNQDGEVIIGNVLLKVGEKGLVFGDLTKKAEIVKLAEQNEISDYKKGVCPYFPTEECFYVVRGFDEIYIHDTFNLISGAPENDLNLSTKAVIWAQSGVKTNSQMEVEYVWPSNQKNIFDCNSNIANDTKIYRQNFVVYSEAGVKTKTMKKTGFIWNKFYADITSAVTNICIEEGGVSSLPQTSGWIDINETYYSGETFLIATKKVPNPSSLPTSNQELIAQCEAAKTWAHSLNSSFNDEIDGVRYVFNSTSAYSITRIKDIVESGYEKKITIIFNLKPQWSSYRTDLGLFGNFNVDEDQARIGCVTFYGHSTYNNETRGSILSCYRQ